MDVVKSGLEIFALLLVVIISSALYERPQDGRRFQGQGSAHIQRQRQTAPWSLNCTSGTTIIIVPSCVYESSTYALHPDFRLGVILLKLLRDVLAHIAVALLPNAIRHKRAQESCLNLDCFGSLEHLCWRHVLVALTQDIQDELSYVATGNGNMLDLRANDVALSLSTRVSERERERVSGEIHVRLE